MGLREQMERKTAYTLTAHAIARFAERGGRDLITAVGQQYGVHKKRGGKDELLAALVLDSAAYRENMEIVLDCTVQPRVPALLLTMDLKSCAMSVGVTTSVFLPVLVAVIRLNESRVLEPDFDLDQMRRGGTVITVLTPAMVEANRSCGMYARTDGTSFPLTQPVLKKEILVAYTDNAVAYAWAKTYFEEHENASVHQAMKAANNSKPRVPPVESIFSKARMAAQAERFAAGQEAKKLPALPPETSKLPAAVAGVGQLPTLCRDCGRDRALRTPTCTSCSPKPIATPTVSPAPEVPMAAVPKIDPTTTTEKDALRAAGVALLAVMRQFDLEAVIMTVTDKDGKGRAEWTVERKRNDTGGADL